MVRVLHNEGVRPRGIRPRARPSASLKAGLILAAVSAVGVASASVFCGPTAVAGASRSAQHAGKQARLCASAGTVTRLVVRRTDAFPQNHFQFSFPTSVVVDDTAAVRRVARALCALPPVPDTTISCPADFGISYHLAFSRAGVRFRVVTLDATGCQTVSGLGRRRWIARSPMFWSVLGTAMKLEHPSSTTFRGSGPNS